MCPWKLLATPDAYIFMLACWLFGIAWSGRRHHGFGSTRFTILKGHIEINPRAIVLLVLGVAVALVGLFVSPLHFLYHYAWFVGFFVAGGIYLALMKLMAPVGARWASGFIRR
jgi:nucleobase:cation symporter-1, NCS1 family